MKETSILKQVRILDTQKEGTSEAYDLNVIKSVIGT